MKILNLAAKNGVYSCNVYLVLGSWNTLRDVNTLVDVGRDPSFFERLDQASTGVGKKRVEQVILTHSHYDHAANLPRFGSATLRWCMPSPPPWRGWIPF